LFVFLPALVLDNVDAIAIPWLKAVLADALVQVIEATIRRSVVAVGRTRNGVTNELTDIAIGVLDITSVADAFLQVV
jgi:hypothetical protein